MVHRSSLKVPSRFLKYCVLGLSATILFGCAKALVVPINPASEGLPKPDHIVVYDFVVTSGDVQLDVGVGTKMLRDAKGTSQTAEEIRVGRAVAEALSKKWLRNFGERALRPIERVLLPLPLQPQHQLKGNSGKSIRETEPFGLWWVSGLEGVSWGQASSSIRERDGRRNWSEKRKP